MGAPNPELVSAQMFDYKIEDARRKRRPPSTKNLISAIPGLARKCRGLHSNFTINPFPSRNGTRQLRSLRRIMMYLLGQSSEKENRLGNSQFGVHAKATNQVDDPNLRERYEAVARRYEEEALKSALRGKPCSRRRSIDALPYAAPY